MSPPFHVPLTVELLKTDEAVPVEKTVTILEWPVTREEHYTCDPRNVLRLDQVMSIASQIGFGAVTGVVNGFRWRI